MSAPRGGSEEAASSFAPIAAAPTRWIVTDAKHVVSVGGKRTSVFAHVRDSDWGMAILAIALGLILMQPGMMIHVGTQGSWTWPITTDGWAAILCSVGVIRIAAIKINGRWQSGNSALIRAVAAVIGAAFWSTIGYTLILTDAHRGQGLGVFTVIAIYLTGVEVRCTLRSLDDRRLIREASRRVRNADGG